MNLRLAHPHFDARARFYALCAAALAIGMLVAVLPFNQLVVAIGVLVALCLIGLIFAQPVVGIGLTLFAAPLGPLENIQLGLPVESAQVLLALTLAAWVARAFLQRQARISVGSMFVPLVAFLVVGVLSFFPARSFELWAKEVAKWAGVLLIYLLAYNECRVNPKARPFIITAIILTVGFQSALGIYQFGLRGEGPQEFAILDGRFFRAYGTIEQPNPFAGYMGMTWTFAFGVAVYLWQRVIPAARSRIPQQNTARAAAIAMTVSAIAAMAAIALVLSWSRGAWLGAGAAVVVMLFVIVRRPVLTVSLLGAATIIVLAFNLTALLPASLLNRLTDFTQEFTSLDVRNVTVSASNYSLIERLAHWQAAQNMILAEPYLGVGLGNYVAAYDQYRALNWSIALGHAHNYYLNIFAETGVIGLLAYGGLWIAAIALTIRAITQSRNRARYPMTLTSSIALGLLGCWAHVSTHHLVDNLYVANNFLLIGVFFSFISAHTDESVTSN